MANKKFYYHNKKESPKPVDNYEPTLYSAEQLSLTLDQLGLSATTIDLLSKNRISTSADLVKRTIKDMYKVQGLNKKILFEVQNALKSKGMDLREDPTVENKQQQDKQPQPAEKKPQQKPAQKQGNVGTAQNSKSQQNSNAKQQPKADNAKFQQKVENKPVQKQAVKKVIDEFDEEFWEEEANKSHSKFGLTDRKQQKNAAAKAPSKDGYAPGVWRKVMKGGKWGYSNGFRIVIPTVYDEIFAFKEGLASVEIDEKCGYIDENNVVVIPLEYETAMSFSEGYAMVVKNNKCGYIDKEGSVVIPFEYDAATPFENGEAKVKKDGKWGTLTPDNKVVWI